MKNLYLITTNSLFNTEIKKVWRILIMMKTFDSRTLLLVGIILVILISNSFAQEPKLGDIGDGNRSIPVHILDLYDGIVYRNSTVFGIEGEKINGMDFFEVSQAAIRARDHIYENSKPYVLEMDTYRYRGHSMSDPATYRSKDEVNEMKSNDPIISMKNKLLKDYKIKEDDLNDVEINIKKQIKEVEKFSLESPLPEINELFTEVYL